VLTTPFPQKPGTVDGGTIEEAAAATEEPAAATEDCPATTEEAAATTEEGATTTEEGATTTEEAAATTEDAAATTEVAAAPATLIVPTIAGKWNLQKNAAVPACVNADVVKTHAAELQGFMSKVTPNAAVFVPEAASAAFAADVTVWNPDCHVNVIVSPTLRLTVAGLKVLTPAVAPPT